MESSLFTRWRSTFFPLLLNLAPSVVEAKLPFNSKISKPVLKHSNEVSFDPLGVAAVLYNPRAEASAARLYTQPDRTIFRWPHTMMIGGALTPLSVLVDYLTSQFSSIRPAASLCLKDRTNLPVRSTMVFSDLPISLSNAWLRDTLAFKSSRYPENDFVVAEVEDAFVQPNILQPKVLQAIVFRPNLVPVPVQTRHAPVTVLDLLGWLCGLLLVTGTVFSVLIGDVWAITLFFIYTTHWIASTWISFNPLAKLQEIKIVPSDSTEYAVYQRPGGGTVVFTGRKDTLERWARTTWIFDSSWQNHFLHWFWTITGTLASIASVACMVNMAAYLQLGFLGVLGYSSLAEILATRATRKLQADANHYREPHPVLENDTRTMGIIRATLECGLNGQMWFKLELLPKTDVFADMLDLLDVLRTVEDEAGMKTAVAGYRGKFGALGEGKRDKRGELVERIANEVERAWRGLRGVQQV